MQNLKVGDKVKFSKPLSEFEKSAVYEVVNINENTKRALITILNSKLPITPTELVGIETITKI